MRSAAVVLRPVVGGAVVVGVLFVLRDHVADASVRSALGWSTASVVTESLVLWLSKKTTRSA